MFRLLSLLPFLFALLLSGCISNAFADDELSDLERAEDLCGPLPKSYAETILEFWGYNISTNSGALGTLNGNTIFNRVVSAEFFEAERANYHINPIPFENVHTVAKNPESETSLFMHLDLSKVLSDQSNFYRWDSTWYSAVGIPRIGHADYTSVIKLTTTYHCDPNYNMWVERTDLLNGYLYEYTKTNSHPTMETFRFYEKFTLKINGYSEHGDWFNEVPYRRRGYYIFAGSGIFTPQDKIDHGLHYVPFSGDFSWAISGSGWLRESYDSSGKIVKSYRKAKFDQTLNDAPYISHDTAEVTYSPLGFESGDAPSSYREKQQYKSQHKTYFTGANNTLRLVQDELSKQSDETTFLRDKTTIGREVMGFPRRERTSVVFRHSLSLSNTYKVYRRTNTTKLANNSVRAWIEMVPEDGDWYQEKVSRVTAYNLEKDLPRIETLIGKYDQGWYGNPTNRSKKRYVSVKYDKPDLWGNLAFLISDWQLTVGEYAIDDEPKEVILVPVGQSRTKLQSIIDEVNEKEASMAGDFYRPEHYPSLTD